MKYLTFKTAFFILTTSVMMFIYSCKTIENNTADCIDESKISEGPCTMDYSPVCGCDGKTYSNTCVAERSEVTSWTDGECTEK